MRSTTFGIIGAGMVGNSVAKGLMLDGDVRVYDSNEKRKTHELEEVVSCDFVFVCVPTPMEDVEGGKSDLSIMNDIFDKINKIKIDQNRHGMENNNSIFIIKSTIPVGTTEKYNKKYSFSVVHCPEFLTARTSFIDFLLPSRIIIGGEDSVAVAKVEKLFSTRFPGTSVLTMGSKEAELVKYVCNCFFATKVLFFNEMRLLSDKLGMNWDHIMEGTLSDGRIAHSHCQIPGHDGLLGVGGLCLPGNAKIELLAGPGFRKENEGNPRGNNEVITLENLYDNIFNKTQKDRLKYEKRKTVSFDSKVSEQDLGKTIEKVTQREIDEELIVFETDQGNFECTQDHYMPIKRDKEFLLIQAKNIKETDELFCIKK